MYSCYPQRLLGPDKKPTDAWQPWLTPRLGLLIVAAAFAAAAALSWRKWPDLLIDFGLQLYLPWKMASGSVLYRDVMYLAGGPLSQCCHAFLFKLFGASLGTLIVANLALTAAFLVMVYRCFLGVADPLTATVICVGIILVSAFAHIGEIGNYNFVTPYCHEVVHGVMLSILAVALLAAWLNRRRAGFAAGAGFCAGLVFLTKPEVFLALGLSVVAAFALGLATQPRRFAARSAAALLACGCAPVLAFVLYFLRVEGWAESWRSAAFAWVPLLGSPVAKDPFYLWCLGLDQPMFHLRRMLVYSGFVALVLAFYAWLFARPLASHRLLPLLAVAPLLGAASCFDWTDCGRVLPLLNLALCLWLGLRCREPAERPAAVLPLLWSVFALALLAKLGLFSRVWHYGFVLAMPAFAGAVYLLLWLLPRILAGLGTNARLFRATMLCTLALGLALLFAQSLLVYRDKTVPVGTGGDRILALDPKRCPPVTLVQSSLAWLRANTTPQSTLAVLPDGVMLNYLSRRTNPARYFSWNPAELAAFGQGSMRQAFLDGAPDYVLLISRDVSEFGVKPFGTEERFGAGLLRWIREHYQPVYAVGDDPLDPKGFGVRILQKKSPGPTSRG